MLTKVQKMSRTEREEKERNEKRKEIIRVCTQALEQYEAEHRCAKLGVNHNLPDGSDQL